MTREFALPGRPLTPAQQQALVALVELCPSLGQEVDAKTVADEAQMAGGATTLALRGLARRQLVAGHEMPEVWSPTLTGRALAASLADRQARTGKPQEPRAPERGAPDRD